MTRALLLAALLGVCSPWAALAQTGRLYGDCALPADGTVNVLDALASGRFSVGLDPAPSPGTLDFVACDVTEDGVINVLDTFSMSSYSVGRVVPDPVGQPILNSPPAVEAGGPHVGVVGGVVTLDGSATTDDHLPLSAIAWDLDDNGSYETPGVTALFACASVGSFTVRLRATDGFGVTATDPASISCSAPVHLYTQWTNAAGVPISAASVGAAVFLEICTSIAATQAFQAVVTVTGPVGRSGNGSDLASSLAAGVCANPTGSDVVNQYTAQATPANPFNFQDYSVSPSPGVGPVGLARVPFTAQSAGAVTVGVQVQVWALFTGQAPTQPLVLAAPLTVQ